MEEDDHCTIYRKVDKKNGSYYTGVFTFVNYIQNFIRHPAVKVKSISTGYYLDHQCRFQSSRSTTNGIFCIRQILEEKWEYNEAIYRLQENL